MVLLALFLARFLDPVIAIVALAGAYRAQAWWQVGIAAVCATALSEIVLSLSQVSRRFDAGVFLIGIIAAGAWGGALYAYMNWRKRT